MDTGKLCDAFGNGSITAMTTTPYKERLLRIRSVCLACSTKCWCKRIAVMNDNEFGIRSVPNECSCHLEHLVAGQTGEGPMTVERAIHERLFTR